MPCPVTLLHRAEDRFAAAVQVRCYQLAEIAGRWLARRFAVTVRAIPPRAADPEEAWAGDLAGGVVVLGPGADAAVSPDRLRRLARANRAVLADLGAAPAPPRAGVDLHLVGTLGACRQARAARPDLAVRHLTWPADLRLQRFRARARPADRLRALHLGPADGLSPLPAGVTCAGAAAGAFAAFLPRLGGFNLHLAAPAPAPSGPAPPALPVLAAAACGANLLIPRDAPDACAHLGADYPFLLPSGRPADLAQGLAAARAAFGGPDWRRGLEIMRDVAERSSPAYVASDLERILTEAADLRPGLPQAA